MSLPGAARDILAAQFGIILARPTETNPDGTWRQKKQRKSKASASGTNSEPLSHTPLPYFVRSLSCCFLKRNKARERLTKVRHCSNSVIAKLLLTPGKQFPKELRMSPRNQEQSNMVSIHRPYQLGWIVEQPFEFIQILPRKTPTRRAGLSSLRLRTHQFRLTRISQTNIGSSISRSMRFNVRLRAD